MKQLQQSFPSVRIPSTSGGLPVEVTLIVQLGHGTGDAVFASIAARQRRHLAFINELDEPSAKLGGTNFSKNDPTSLYSFIVGQNGHPFHRHAGHRIFTAVSGSGGAQLRFSSATKEEIAKDPWSFVRALRFINIPPDCMFTVRFGGDTWHQFVPLRPSLPHPALFALSCHSNELSGNLDEEIKKKIIANEHSIPTLTELLPDNVQKIFNDPFFRIESVPTTTLALDAPSGTLHRVVCDYVRDKAGILRRNFGFWRLSSGFLCNAGLMSEVKELGVIYKNNLLANHLNNIFIDHEDCFEISTSYININDNKAPRILSLLLDGFLANSPKGVTHLMTLRNALVSPLGLRTSKVGCPVSSLLSSCGDLFFEKHPVIDRHITDQEAGVILGADDKHLQFRSLISIKIEESGLVKATLANRVHCKNLFGKFYIHAINRIHRQYVAPAMLRMAMDYAITYSA